MPKTKYITKEELNKIKAEYRIILCHASEYTEKNKKCPFYNECDEEDMRFGCPLTKNMSWERIECATLDLFHKGMVNHEHKIWRSRTFDEYYAGREVD